jgi:hypothetical protein
MSCLIAKRPVLLSQAFSGWGFGNWCGFFLKEKNRGITQKRAKKKEITRKLK